MGQAPCPLDPLPRQDLLHYEICKYYHDTSRAHARVLQHLMVC